MASTFDRQSLRQSPQQPGESSKAQQTLTRRRFLAIGAAGATVGLLAACAPAASVQPAATAKPAGAAPTAAPVVAAPTTAAAQPAVSTKPAASAAGQTLVVGWTNGAEAIDTNFNYSRRSMEVYRNVGMFAFRFPAKPLGEVYVPDFTKLVGQAAKEWKLNEDQTKLTITLKEGIMSPTGNELTADDAIWKNQRLWAAGAESFIRDAMRLTREGDIKKEGKYSYSIQASKPNILGEIIHAHIGTTILDSKEFLKHATADDPWATKWAASNIASFGPMKLTEHTAGQSWTFERNENYFDPTEFSGNVTKIINRVVPSSANRLALLEAGSIDLAFDLEASEMKQLENKAGIRVDHVAGNMLHGLAGR